MTSTLRMGALGAVLVAGLAAGGCKKGEEQPAAKGHGGEPAMKKEGKEPPKSNQLTGEELAKWYDHCWELWHGRKFDEFAACYADDVKATVAGMPPEQGKAAVMERAKAWATAFPDGLAEAQLTLVSGRAVFSVRLFTGTHTGPFKGPMGEIAATNKKVGMIIFHHVVVDDRSRVTSELFVHDSATLMFQLGLSPGPARAALDKGWEGVPMLVVARDDDTERKNTALVKTAYDLWNKRDKAFYDLVADDCVESFNMEPTDTVGKQAMQEHNAGFQAAFSDIRVDVETVWAAGDYTVGFARIRGTNDGDMGPMKATGKKLDLGVVEIIKWKDGKAVSTTVFADGIELKTQLGMMAEK